MNDDNDQFEGWVVTTLMETAPAREPDRLLRSVLSSTRSKRPRPIWLANLKEPPMRISTRVAVGSPTLRLVSILGISLVLILALGAAVAIGASLMPRPEPPSEPAVALESISRRDSQALVSGVRYTSDLFTPRVSFVLAAFGGGQEVGQETDWCLGEGSLGDHPPTSPRMLVLSWRAGCVWDLRLIRPYAVACGTPDAHPDAAELAAAILANPGMDRAVDLGDLSAAASVAPGMDLSGHVGRVLRIERSLGKFDPVSDPDHCRLLPEPGSTDPVIEIRGDVMSDLLLVDVDGELVIVRMSAGGYDTATGTEALTRGYATTASPEALSDLLTTVHDFRFE